MARIRKIPGGVLITGIGAKRIRKNMESAPRIDFEAAEKWAKNHVPVYSERAYERLREIGKL